MSILEANNNKGRKPLVGLCDYGAMCFIYLEDGIHLSRHCNEGLDILEVSGRELFCLITRDGLYPDFSMVSRSDCDCVVEWSPIGEGVRSVLRASTGAELCLFWDKAQNAKHVIHSVTMFRRGRGVIKIPPLVFKDELDTLLRAISSYSWRQGWRDDGNGVYRHIVTNQKVQLWRES